MILWELFSTFFKIGAFTFGGGYAMLPMIRQEIVRRSWMSQAELIDFIAVSESTPGPFAVNVSTFTGMKLAGLPGAFAATLGVVLPSFLIILAVARIYDLFCRSRVVKGVMSRLRPAVVGLIVSASVSVGAEVFFPGGIRQQIFMEGRFWISAGIFGVSLVLLCKKKIRPVRLILLSAAVGIAAGSMGLLG